MGRKRAAVNREDAAAMEMAKRGRPSSSTGAGECEKTVKTPVPHKIEVSVDQMVGE